MFFEKFPYLYYTLDDKNTYQIVPDILRRIKLSEELKNNNAFFDQYDIRDGETPEMLADKFYGSPMLHWVILLANDIIDPRFDWPLDYYNLVEFCKGKYGENSIYQLHHYADEAEYIVAGYRGLDESSTFLLPIPIVLESSGSVQSTLLLQNHPSNLIPVSNFSYEDAINEKKRRINILKPQVVSEFDSNFTSLIKQ